ncbi:hypothetical protein [Paenibacillus wynnii]|uniref:Uncharacterized protein n=1 Tax=Paenibacillus wynnii TaxID=268407 RepID=A0A098M8E6_9BACL|nr:hypothetical protein [Paenibacillus wynnii]KGE18331.1 hypothetical protein PWYN_27855 [Paenibacillus wynnii]
MFNKRWKRVLLWVLSAIIVLGVGGLFAANYAVDKLMNSMVGSFDVESENTVDNQVEGIEPIVPTSTTAPTASTEDGNNVQADSSQDKPETTATATPTTTSATGESSNNGYTAQVSTDKAKEIQKNVTVKEKADVVSIVLSQLSVSDINHLKELASGGLSVDEKREARSIILGKVSEQQYNELAQIAKKYGVSQGKTRDQVLAEESGSE